MSVTSRAIRVVDNYHVPTSESRQQVCKLVSCGLNATEIAFVFGAMEHEIKQHYAQELEHGNALVTAMVGGSLLKSALAGDVNASRFWLQTRAKWAVPQQVEVTGRDGGPIQVQERRELMERVLGLTKVVREQRQEARTEAGGETRAGGRATRDSGTGTSG